MPDLTVCYWPGSSDHISCLIRLLSISWLTLCLPSPRQSSASQCLPACSIPTDRLLPARHLPRSGSSASAAIYCPGYLIHSWQSTSYSPVQTAGHSMGTPTSPRSCSYCLTTRSWSCKRGLPLHVRVYNKVHDSHCGPLECQQMCWAIIVLRWNTCFLVYCFVLFNKTTPFLSQCD